MNEKHYTSRELSKKLVDLDIETEFVWYQGCDGGYWFLGRRDEVEGDESEQYGDSRRLGTPIYPAFDILHDICVQYAKEIFGRDRVHHVQNGTVDTIFLLFRQGRMFEFEECILNNCKFKKKKND